VQVHLVAMTGNVAQVFVTDAARSSRRPLIEVVDEVLGGQRLPRPRR
jgi:hypothetical protein